jgi:hypothetical protein
LLAHHILKDDPFVSFDWQVGLTQDWVTREYRVTNVEHVSALGYYLWATPSLLFTSELMSGLERVVERDAFKGEHLSLARRPSRLLGIVLGARALGADGENALKWCQSVLEEMKKRGSTDFDPLVSYLLYRAYGARVSIGATAGSELYDLCFFDWAIRHQVHETEPSLEQLQANRNRALFQATTSLKFESAPQAAFILATINTALFQALAEATIQPKHVVAVLKNFESAMRRWRWDSENLQKPVRWPVTQEREVQDILWLILRSYFPDVVDEDTLPKLGHSTYKADFGITSLKLIIEAKFANSKEDFKKIEKEVQEDSVPYLRDVRYEALIVFIYDDSASVQEHETTRRALLEIPGVVEAVIVCRPSQLEPKGPSSKWRNDK